MTTEIKKSITNIYEEYFFKDNFVDKNTGIVEIDKSRKLATFPYIGSKYGKSKRILIVGFDIGKDETLGTIQTLDERNKSIEKSDLRGLNPHIGGTYFTSLYFLKDVLDLNDFWEDTKSTKYGKTFNTILRKVPSHPIENPLSYIAMTNFYKYVTVGRGIKNIEDGKVKKSRKGNFDRKFIDREREINLFLAEIEVLNPEIIFFQSFDFRNLDSKIKDKLLEKGVKLFYAYHPSDFSETGGNIPENYFSKRTFELK